MENHLSRRTALLAIGGATAVAAVPVAAATRASSPISGTAFVALKAKLDTAYTAAFAFEEDVYGPALDAWHAACEAIPHVTLEPDPYSGKLHPVSTANPEDVRDARRFFRGLVRIDPYPDLVKHHDLMKRLKEAADARDAEKERLKAHYRIDHLFARFEELQEIGNVLACKLIETPAPDAATLGMKIEYLWADDPGAGFCDDWTNAIVADARRLLANGRA